MGGLAGGLDRQAEVQRGAPTEKANGGWESEEEPHGKCGQVWRLRGGGGGGVDESGAEIESRIKRGRRSVRWQCEAITLIQAGSIIHRTSSQRGGSNLRHTGGRTFDHIAKRQRESQP